MPWSLISLCGAVVSVCLVIDLVTGQFADKPTRGQSSRGLVNSRTSQLAEMFDGKCTVINCYKCDLR